MNTTEHKKTILVVEDERPLIQAIQTKLEKCNLLVVTSRSINQAIDYLENIKKIDAIWLDHYLPGEKTGLDFVAYLKKTKSKWASIPIFIVSNTASSTNVRSYL